MKNWQAAVRTWDRNGYSSNNSNKQTYKQDKAQELDDFYHMAARFAESEE